MTSIVVWRSIWLLAILVGVALGMVFNIEHQLSILNKQTEAYFHKCKQ